MRRGGIRPTRHNNLGNPLQKHIQETNRVQPDLREDVRLSGSREEQDCPCVREEVILNTVFFRNDQGGGAARNASRWSLKA